MDAADVLVRNLASEAQLFLEVFLHLRVGGNLGLQNFHGNDFARFKVTGLINHACAAGAHLGQNLVT